MFNLWSGFTGFSEGGGFSSGGGLWGGGTPTPTPTPTPASGPLLGPQSIEFASRNGRGQRAWLEATHPTQMFRSGTVLASGIVVCRVQIDMAAMRGTANLGAASSDVLQGDSFIFGNVNGVTSNVGLTYYGRANSNVAYRGRFVFMLNMSGQQVLCLSPVHVSNLPVTVIGEVDSASLPPQARVGLAYDTGPISWGAWVQTGAFAGISTATPPALRFGANNLTQDDQLTGRAKGTRISDWAFIRLGAGEALPDPSIYLRLQAGERPDAIWSAPQLDAYWRMWGTSDLAQTAGAGSYGALTALKAGTYDDVGLLTGPSVGARKVGAVGLVAGFPTPGYSWLPVQPCIIGTPPDDPNAPQSVPFWLLNTADSAATHFEARAVRTSDRTTGWTPWVRVTSSPLAAGATANVALPNVAPSPDLCIEIRREDSPDVRHVIGPCGVGPIFVTGGPSTVDRPIINMPTLPSATTNAAWADVLPAGAASTCYFAAMITAAQAIDGSGRGNIPACEKVVMRLQFGLGATSFAKQWTALNPDRVCLVINASLAGSGVFQWYNNNNIPSSTYPHLGDWVTPGSGYVTDMLLRCFPSLTDRRVTSFLVKLGAQDMGVASQANVRLNVYYNGANRTGDGVGNEASPGPRHWLQPAAGLPWAPRMIFWNLPRSYSNDGGTLAEVQSDQAQLVNWRNSYEFCMANMALPLRTNTVRGAHATDITPMSVTDRLHHGENEATGTARWLGRWAYDCTKFVGRLPNYTQANPPSTFRIVGGRTAIEIDLTPVNGGAWVNAAGTNAVNGFSVTIDGGTTWTHLPGTISGNTVTLPIDLTGVPNTSVLAWYDRDGLPAVVNADPNITFADDVAARQFFLCEARPDMLGYLVGLPLNRHAAAATPV